MNVFEVAAKITLNSKDYENSLKQASDQTNSFGSKIGSVFGTIGKITAAGIGAAAAGFTALTKNAVAGYADYEQLVGGVETLFGTGGKGLSAYAESIGKTTDEASQAWHNHLAAQNEVLKNADNAYMTAGLSANDYMETVTSFSAALIGSLDGDTQAAAKAADMAITDMADNANKMGTSMESIQNAYQGFAKQNYTMLDNLKLGYGGTKEEMQRLLEDAQKISGVEYDMSNLADVYDAIHVVQTELGITGTTAKEAATTISGSTAMVKASWQNLLTGMADDDADFDSLITNFVDSIGIAADNILPRIEIALQGLGDLVVKLAPVIGEKLPELFNTVFPSLLQASTSLFINLAESLPSLISSLLPSIINAVIQIVTSLASNIPNIISTLLPSVLDAAGQIIHSLAENLPIILSTLPPALLDIAGQLITSLTEKLPDMVSSIFEYLGINVDTSALSDLFVSAIETIKSVFEDLSSYIDPIAETLKNVFTAIVSIFNDIAANENTLSFLKGVAIAIGAIVAAIGIWTAVQTALNLVLAANPIGLIITAIGLLIAIIALVITYWDDLKVAMSNVWEHIKEIFGKLGDWFKTNVVDKVKAVFAGIGDWFKEKFNAARDGIKNAFSTIGNFFKEKYNSIVNTFTNIKEKFREIGHNIVEGIKNGISKAWEKFTEWVHDKFTGLVSGVKNVLGIHSPSKVFAGIGQFMAAGLNEGWTDEFNDVQKDINSDLTFDASVTSTGHTNESKNDNIILWLEENLPNLLNQSIILDTGALVGQTVGAYDAALGKLAFRNVRGVI